MRTVLAWIMGKDIVGLTQTDAKTKLAQFGPNLLPEKPPTSDIVIFISQLKNPLVYVLAFASLVTIFIGHYNDAVIILLAILINSVLGFVQERKANKSLSALKKLVTQFSEVMRDGKREKVETKNLVPGDVVYLFAGSKVPADGVLHSANRLFLDEALLTGESTPVGKVEVVGSPTKAKEVNKVSMGTIVTSGQGIFVVEKTGANTKMGRIAQDVQEAKEESPLTRQLATLSKKLAILVLFLVTITFIIGIVSKRPLLDMFTIAVALAVSAIPEGLLIGLTVVLAIGMQRMHKRKGLVRRLVSAETLGGVTTICLDKTGTLTQGKMQVVGVVGDEKDIAIQMIVANDLDDPLVIAGFDWAKKKLGKDADSMAKEVVRLDSLPFSSEERFFACLNKGKTKNTIFVNGAPEYIAEWCGLSTEEKKRIKEDVERLTASGRRLIGLARKEVEGSKVKLDTKDAKAGLTWIGLLSFTDPVREGVKEALAKAEVAGIKLLVITGDYPKTATAVMREVGMAVGEKEILTGKEMEELTTDELAQKLVTIRLFARTTPEQKLKIMVALKKKGEVVAMMGDGVNDAPALAKSDIGIVVGEATDVAKESADLILLDSRFNTVLAAVEEGRGIFDNIRKVIMYLMSTAFNEITAVVGAIILGLPLPVTAAQILWINIVSDGLPDLALTVEPKRVGIMQEKPRLAGEALVVPWMKVMIGIVSVTSGLLALLVFMYALKTTGDTKLAQSVGFVALGMNSLFYVFSIRTLQKPFWEVGLLENKWLVGAVIIGFILQLLPFATNTTRVFFGIVDIPANLWILVFATTVVMFFVIEIIKVIVRKGPWFSH